MTIDTERRRRVKPRDERRRDLLDAAVDVFARDGLRGATVSAITQEAGVAKGTFYLYFASKERLLGELKKRFVDQLVDRAAELLSSSGENDWTAAVDTTIESMVDFTLARRELIQVFARESSTAQTVEIFGECVATLIAMFADGIRAGAAAGAFEVDDAEMTAALLHHAVEGTLQHQILYEGTVDRQRLVAAATELTHRALTSPA